MLAPGVHFRLHCYSVTQQPYKTAYYVALLLQLSIKSDSIAETKEEDDVEAQIGDKRKAEDEGEADCGREVLENLNIAFRGWVESRQWLNVRQCVSDVLGFAWAADADTAQLQFFSLLLPAGLVTGISLLELYKSLLSVLSELGGGGDRAERVIRAVGEGLFRVSTRGLLLELPPDTVRAARTFKPNSPRKWTDSWPVSRTLSSVVEVAAHSMIH